MTAAEWLVRMRDENVSPQDCAAFVQWLEESPEHEAAYVEVTRAVASVTNSLTIERAPRAKQLLPRGSKATALGALVACVACLVVLAVISTPPSREIKTALGEVREFSLADGSQVELNTNSRARIEYTDTQRRVRLDSGEAFFDVEHDPDRPFLVEARGQIVRAIGTQFVVRIQDGSVAVLVVDGTVALQGVLEDELVARQLHRGQRSEASSRTPTTSAVTQDQMSRSLAWRTGWLTFSGETLEEAANEVSRHTGADFTFASDAARAQLVYAHFRSNDLEAFLDGIASNPALKIQRTSDLAVTVSSRP